MKKIFVISSLEPSSWKSCEIIESNLIQSYRAAFGKNASVHLLSTDSDSRENDILIKKIIKKKPDSLVFLSQKVPHTFIRDLSTALSKKQSPSLYFHVYGSFTLHCRQWLSLEPFLKGRPVRFIAASNKYKRILEKFIPATSVSTDVVPFPVSSTYLKTHFPSRSDIRRKMGYADDDFIITFAGRITLQKNIDILLRAYQDICQNNPNKKIKLILCGTFDDSGFPQALILPGHNSAYSLFSHQLKSLPQFIRDTIVHRGNLIGQHLLDHFLAADLFLSLSLFHDEDFGMAPAEALACGTPAVLTGWGGYTDFSKIDKKSVALIKTSVSLRGPKFSVNEVVDRITRFIETPKSAATRVSLRLKMKNRYSIKSIAENIKASHTVRVLGFEGFLKDLSELHKTISEKSILSSPSSRKLYSRIYRDFSSSSQPNRKGLVFPFENWKKVYSILRSTYPEIARRNLVERIDLRSWPASIKSISPIVSCFLNEINFSFPVEAETMCLLRDGQSQIEIFFKKFPRPPKQVNARFLVSTKFEKLVPPIWKNYISSYRLCPQPTANAKRANLLITRVATEKYLNRKLKSKLIEFIKSDSYKNIFVLNTEHDMSPYGYCQEVVQLVPEICQTFRWNRFLRHESFSDFDVIEINDNQNCSDNFVLNSLLSKDANLVARFHPEIKAARRPDEIYIPISLYHGIVTKA